MKEFLIFVILMIPTLALLFIILKKVFKNSLLFTFGVIWFSTQSILLVEAYGIGKLGTLFDFLWAFPIGISVCILGMIYLAKNYKKILTDTSNHILRLSEGDLNVKIDEKLFARKDEVGIILNSLNKLIKQLRIIVGEVQSNAENVLNASMHLSSSSEQLSQGSNEQASSLEEISSTMEEIAGNIASNTDNARITSGIANESSNSMQEVADAADGSYKSVNEIADKILIINEIANQTNILALNAAVESARAGEYGRGFAVVASEVRKLAENSKRAAEDIAQLSGHSLQETETSHTKLTKIKPNIEKTSQLIQEITAASMEQNNGVDQVNNAIQELNNVTQQTASMAEEIASSSEELSGQARGLKDAISFFKIE
nr:methyl-accepting chemotaxis protein [uncultured Carboxylicivirga sp.]